MVTTRRRSATIRPAASTSVLTRTGCRKRTEISPVKPFSPLLAQACAIVSSRTIASRPPCTTSFQPVKWSGIVNEVQASPGCG